MILTPVERLILLKLTQVLELIDPANADEYDAHAQSLELGTPNGIAKVFELISIDPLPCLPRVNKRHLRLVSLNDRPHVGALAPLSVG